MQWQGYALYYLGTLVGCLDKDINGTWVFHFTFTRERFFCEGSQSGENAKKIMVELLQERLAEMVASLNLIR